MSGVACGPGIPFALAPQSRSFAIEVQANLASCLSTAGHSQATSVDDSTEARRLSRPSAAPSSLPAASSRDVVAREDAQPLLLSSSSRAPPVPRPRLGRNNLARRSAPGLAALALALAPPVALHRHRRPRAPSSAAMAREDVKDQYWFSPQKKKRSFVLTPLSLFG